MEEVTFEYRLTGFRWSEAAIQIGRSGASLSASYLDDALGDLVRAAVDIAQGATSARISWAEEPGEYRWVLTRNDDQLDVRVLWFDELWGSDPDERGKEGLAATCTVRAFLLAVAAGAERVRDDVGTESYRAQWIENDFPSRELNHLRELLARTH